MRATHVPTQTEELLGFPGTVSNTDGTKVAHDGKLWINLPQQCTLVFKQVS